MKTLIATIAGVAALTAAAAPAAAQSYGYNRGHTYDQTSGWSIDRRQEQLAERIERAQRNGSLTRLEAGQLRSELRAINRLERRYAVNGLNRRDRADLDRRLDQLTAHLRFERRDREYSWR